MRRALVLSAVVLAGCFPDYETDAEVPPNMARLRSAGRSVEFDLKGDSELVRSNVTFSYDFDVDLEEVTVDEFRAWFEGGAVAPAHGASLDAGGVFADEMTWVSSWEENLGRDHFDWTELETEMACSGPRQYPVGGKPATTWQLAEANVEDAASFPMTCVTWNQAVAYCAARHKRLPTAAEWSFARTDGGTSQTYPWGNAEPQCADAIVDADGKGCGFPIPVGWSGRDETKSGVSDLVGSVFEWLWDAHWSGPKTADDWAGEPNNSDLSTEHLRAGGAFITTPDDERNRGVLEKWSATSKFNDAGFRCVRSVK